MMRCRARVKHLFEGETVFIGTRPISSEFETNKKLKTPKENNHIMTVRIIPRLEAVHK